jgi:hypothetical protein
MVFKIPRTMEIEHEELHSKLRKGTTEKGSIGRPAKKLATVMHPHFVKEEDFALPPPGLLPSLSKDKATPDMKDILLMTDKLKVELNQMLKEHEEILGALEKLAASAKKENKFEHLRFGEKLTLHAQTEEEIYYPTAMLVGEYMKLKLSRESAKTSNKRGSTKTSAAQGRRTRQQDSMVG